ncbi:dihydroxyacetone kinase subunit DhaK, partial [Mycobacterium tuberculosis]|nr:dihydroxyacetone kinase subunit DhaK [Mycobacterium tuberculosis]
LSESLAGFAAVHAGLVRLGDDGAYVARAVPAKGKVALISGGGSGHEPLHADPGNPRELRYLAGGTPQGGPTFGAVAATFRRATPPP